MANFSSAVTIRRNRRILHEIQGGQHEKTSRVFTIALALGAISFAPVAGAREEGPTEIEKSKRYQ
jgi:hypothetical protein